MGAASSSSARSRGKPEDASARPPADKEILAAVCTLSSLQLDDAFPASMISAAAQAVPSLSESDLSALRSFEAARQRCLGELSTETLAALHAATGSNMATCETGAEMPVTDADAPASSAPPAGADAATANGEHVTHDDASCGGRESEEAVDASNREAAESAAAFQLETVHKMFTEFDEDGDGLITLEDFEQVLHQLGVGEICGGDQIQSLAKAADANGDGYIDVKEFASWLESFGEGADGMEPTASTENKEVATRAEDTDVIKPDGDHLLNQLQRSRDRLRRVNLRLSVCEAELADAKAEAAESAAKLKKAEDSVNKAEAVLEDQSTASTQFWRTVAGTSACAALSKELDVSMLEAIGNGKYSFVFKHRDADTGRCSVAKMLSLRWSHVAMNEWYMSQIIQDHPNILKVATGSVFLHADEEQLIAKSILKGINDGRLTMKKRTSLPSHYICLLQEFMNHGTVQEWMDQDCLSPVGMLAVMQQVASALAHLHKAGVSHNDIKPQNLLLTGDEADPNSAMTVKLGDLGLGTRSGDHSKDISQFLMTVYCMATGEKFGSQKFRPELVDILASSLAELTGVDHPGASLPCAAAAAEGTGMGKSRETLALGKLPDILRGICEKEMDMAEVRDCAWLQGWSLVNPEPSDS